MDYPDRKPRNKRDPRELEDRRDEPELQLANYSAPFGEEYPWREFGAALPGLESAQATLRPPLRRMH
jgi:hypothetical protein